MIFAKFLRTFFLKNIFWQFTLRFKSTLSLVRTSYIVLKYTLQKLSPKLLCATGEQSIFDKSLPLVLPIFQESFFVVHMWAVARDSSNSHCTELGNAFRWNAQNWSASQVLCLCSTAWKVSKYEVFAGPYFPVFELNTEIYGVNIRIQPEYGKIRTRNNSISGHFSRSVGLIKSKELVANLASQAQALMWSQLCMVSFIGCIGNQWVNTK